MKELGPNEETNSTASSNEELGPNEETNSTASSNEEYFTEYCVDEIPSLIEEPRWWWKI